MPVSRTGVQTDDLISTSWLLVSVWSCQVRWTSTISSIYCPTRAAETQLDREILLSVWICGESEESEDSGTMWHVCLPPPCIQLACGKISLSPHSITSVVLINLGSERPKASRRDWCDRTQQEVSGGIIEWAREAQEGSQASWASDGCYSVWMSLSLSSTKSQLNANVLWHSADKSQTP